MTAPITPRFAGPLWETPKPALLAAVTILKSAFTLSQTTPPGVPPAPLPPGAFIGEDGNPCWAEVATKLPARKRPLRFLTVTRVGGGQVDQTTDVARILVQCFAPDTATCEAMANTARAALRNAASTTVEAPQGPAYLRPNATSGALWPPAITMFIRWYGNETGLADLPHPDIVDYERWQFMGELWIAANR